MSRTECSFIISQIRVRHESLQGGSITGVSISDVSFIVSGAAEADIEQEKGFGKGIRLRDQNSISKCTAPAGFAPQICQAL